MVERKIEERFCLYWWEDDGTDWKQQLACLLGWPVAIAIENTEILDGGGA